MTEENKNLAQYSDFLVGDHERILAGLIDMLHYHEWGGRLTQEDGVLIAKVEKAIIRLKNSLAGARQYIQDDANESKPIGLRELEGILSEMGFNCSFQGNELIVSKH